MLEPIRPPAEQQRGPMRPITFEIDDSPLSLSLPSRGDYLSRLLLSALHAPVASVSQGRCVARQIAFTDDGRKLRVEVGSWNCWPDGRPVVARDILRGIRRAIASPYWRQVLAPIRSVMAPSPDTVEFNLGGPASHLPAALSTIDLAPAPSERLAEATNGPYQLVNFAEDGAIVLAPSAYFPGAGTRSPLRFVINRVPRESPALFERGLVDVTSNTGFPMEHFAAYAAHRDLRVSPSGIFWQLEFSPNARAPWLSPQARSALSLAIDREAVCARYAPALQAARSFGPDVGPCLPPHALPFDLPRAVAQAREHGLAGRELSILYNPYYPNRELLMRVCRHLEPLGVRCVLVPTSFGDDIPPAHDAYLRLRFATFPHLFAIGCMFSWFLWSRHADRATVVNDLCASRPVDVDHASRRLVNTLLETMPAIPLCRLYSVYLQRPGLEGLTFAQDGTFALDRLKWAA